MQNPFKATGKTPHFEYAFSYFQQMARDAVDGRTINVVLLSLKLSSSLKYLNFSPYVLYDMAW